LGFKYASCSLFHFSSSAAGSAPTPFCNTIKRVGPRRFHLPEQLGWQQKLAVEQAGLLILFVLSKHGATPVFACPNFISFL
jgi:hypothetical protein